MPAYAVSRDPLKHSLRPTQPRMPTFLAQTELWIQSAASTQKPSMDQKADVGFLVEALDSILEQRRPGHLFAAGAFLFAASNYGTFPQAIPCKRSFPSFTAAVKPGTLLYKACLGQNTHWSGHQGQQFSRHVEGRCAAAKFQSTFGPSDGRARSSRQEFGSLLQRSDHI